MSEGDNLNLVLAYHERAARMQAAYDAKWEQRERRIARAKGIDSLKLREEFDNQDLEAAGAALLELMRIYPDMAMDALQDLVEEKAVVDNVVVATGHSMLGLSLGPGTGKLVSELISEQKPSMDLGPFAVERFG